MVVSDDDGPDFVDELEAELAARRPVPVQQDELQITPNDSKDLESGPVQQDEPEFDESDMEREVVNTRRGLERGKWDSPTAMLRSRAYSVLNQMDQVPGSLPWSRIKLEAAVRVFDEAQAVPVQQDEPELNCPRCHGIGSGEWCGRCGGTGNVPQPFSGDDRITPEAPNNPRPVPVQQDEPEVCVDCGSATTVCQCFGVPVQQDEPEGVCAFPNCSCTENRCPAKGERGPFCDHGFHPRLCGRCAPVPEAVTDEDEVQCQMCKTVQPRPDKECGHCGAGPKYLCPIHTRPAAVPVQQERSVRAPKTDDPHSLPRVDDLLDDIPVQQEPGRYSDRERVADYLASAQGVEFHDLNDDAQREWLMRASDALRAVWSIGRLVDADDGYEVMCEPVAAMVEEVRAALVPVQQDEPEGKTDPLAWVDEIEPLPDGYTDTDEFQCVWAAIKGWDIQRVSGQGYAGATGDDVKIILDALGLPEPVLDPPAVPSVGSRDRVACELANLEYERSGRLCETEDFYADADRVLSVLHKAGTQEDEA